MTDAPVPLNDLQRHMAPFSADLRRIIGEVLDEARYVLGPWVERFENAFAGYCGVAHAVGVANGSDALELALRALDCGAGDDIVTVANAGGYATAAILHAGATPVYADIDPYTLLITPDTLQQAITPATKAVIVTHLYGLMADMPALNAFAAARGIAVIEDCAQAHGASIGGRKAGAWGALGCFSFYPSKNLGGIGDAGCVTTHDARLAECLRSLRQHGWQETKYHTPCDIGRNSRMDAMQAAVLAHLLPHLNGWNDRRRQLVQRYRAAFSPHVQFQQVGAPESYVAHLCVIRTSDRERLRQALSHAGIATDIHYPVADYAQPAVIRRIGVRPALPVTENIVTEILTLPCFPEMTGEETRRVIATLQQHIAP